MATKQFKTLFEAAGIDDRDDNRDNPSKLSNQRITLDDIAGPYRNWSAPPTAAVDINQAPVNDLVNHLRLSKRVANSLVSFRKKNTFANPEDLVAVKGIGEKTYLKNRFNVITPNASHPQITHLQLHSEGEAFLANTPYQLEVHFVNSKNGVANLLDVAIFWEGEPYSIQESISAKEAKAGKKIIHFGEEDTLPVGPARFQLKLYDTSGGLGENGIGVYALPNNPLQVRLTPGDAHFRSHIVRSELIISDRSFKIRVDWTVSNTTGARRSFNGVEWIATNGGSHLETINSNHSFSVNNNGSASFRTTFTSPRNSDIGYLLNRSGDFTFRIRLRDDRGTTIEDTIVVQPWLAYNLNIIRVGSLQSGDRSGLRDMANHASSLWQQINLSMNRLENNWRVTGDTSDWEVIDQGEVDDLFAHASVNNNGLDLFIIRDYTGGTGAAFAPGACSKGGSQDGIVMDRRYDGSNNLYWRGMGQTLAHESGHYFGLPHTPDDDASDFRVMHPAFREDRTVFIWDEYYDAHDHCFIYLIH